MIKNSKLKFDKNSKVIDASNSKPVCELCKEEKHSEKTFCKRIGDIKKCQDNAISGVNGNVKDLKVWNATAPSLGKTRVVTLSLELSPTTIVSGTRISKKTTKLMSSQLETNFMVRQLRTLVTCLLRRRIFLAVVLLTRVGWAGAIAPSPRVRYLDSGCTCTRLEAIQTDWKLGIRTN